MAQMRLTIWVGYNNKRNGTWGYIYVGPIFHVVPYGWHSSEAPFRPQHQDITRPEAVHSVGVENNRVVRPNLPLSGSYIICSGVVLTMAYL